MRRQGVFLISILMGCATVPYHRLDVGVDCGVPLGLKQQEFFQSGEEKTRICGDSSGRKLIVKERAPLSEAEARQTLLASIEYFSSLYAPDFDPYLGSHQKPASCPLRAQFTPSAIEEGDRMLSARFELPASQSFLYGACDPRAVPLRSTLIFAYCKGAKAYKDARYFYPAEGKSELKAGDLCAK